MLLVDDSIVRGTTSAQIIELAREAGARQVYFASAAPPVRFPNVYGIDMPTASELVAAGRSERGSRARDRRRLAGLPGSRRSGAGRAPRQGQVEEFDTSCFSGATSRGDVTSEYLAKIESRRADAVLERRRAEAQTDGRDGTGSAGSAVRAVNIL